MKRLDTRVDRGKTRRFGQSQGSGFFISADGYIVTNNHVVRGCTRVLVAHGDASSVARLVATDRRSVTLTGSQAAINATLQAAQGVLYQAALVRLGADRIHIGYRLLGFEERGQGIVARLRQIKTPDECVAIEPAPMFERGVEQAHRADDVGVEDMLLVRPVFP